MVSKVVKDFGREALFELCGSISECVANNKSRLNRIVGCALAFPEKSAGISEAGRTGGASVAGLSK